MASSKQHPRPGAARARAGRPTEHLPRKRRTEEREDTDPIDEVGSAPRITTHELMAKPALTFREVGTLLDMSWRKLWDIDKAGLGPKWFYIGRTRYVMHDEVLRWLRRLNEEDAPRPHRR